MILILLGFVASAGAQFAQNANQYPSESSCPSWNQFEDSRCFWPTMSYDSLPESCRAFIQEPSLSPWLQTFFQAKNSEEYSMMQHRFQKRGGPSICGFCSRKYRCRTRAENANNQRGLPMHCSRKEVEILSKECPGSNPCEFQLEDGGCPSPTPIHAWVFKTTVPPPTPPAHFSGGPAGPRQHFRDPKPSSEENEDDTLNEMPDNQGEPGSRRKRQGGNSFQGFAQPPLQYQAGNFNQAQLGQFGVDPRLQAFQNDTLGPADQWNCVKNKAGSKCLCCCGFYFPDIQSETCRSAKELFAPVPVQMPQWPQGTQASLPAPFFPPDSQALGAQAPIGFENTNSVSPNEQLTLQPESHGQQGFAGQETVYGQLGVAGQEIDGSFGTGFTAGSGPGQSSLDGQLVGVDKGHLGLQPLTHFPTSGQVLPDPYLGTTQSQNPQDIQIQTLVPQPLPRGNRDPLPLGQVERYGHAPLVQPSGYAANFPAAEPLKSLNTGCKNKK